MQYGTLTPFCRNHSEIGNVDQYAWAFGDVVQDHVRTAIKLRYRLLPYLYACFLKAIGDRRAGAAATGLRSTNTMRQSATSMISICWDSDLLVAPVVGPGVTARQVYLPAGDWYDWHTGELVGGKRFLIAATPLDRIPIYARGGAVIPMWPGGARRPPTITSPSWSSCICSCLRRTACLHSMLQEDDGLTFAALAGMLGIEPTSPSYALEPS